MTLCFLYILMELGYISLRFRYRYTFPMLYCRYLQLYIFKCCIWTTTQNKSRDCDTMEQFMQTLWHIFVS